MTFNNDKVSTENKIKQHLLCSSGNRYYFEFAAFSTNKKKSSQSSQTNAVIQCMNKVKERNSTQGSLG